MNSHSSARQLALYALSLLVLAAVACVTLVGRPQEQSTIEAPPEQVTIQAPLPEQASIQIESFGTGPFVLADPSVGLSDLPSYTATLTLSFDGTKDGNGYQWSKTYVMLVSQEPQSRRLSLEKAGDFANLDPVYTAELDGAAYAWQGEDSCEAEPIQEGDSLGDRLEPAGFLSFVVGAEAAGTETVNGVPSSHYTFDEHALAQTDLTDSTGELWVASDGGYVVKYLLTSAGKADYFGEGIEGTLTQDYQLTGIGEPVEIELPADCPPGMVDAPLLPDAVNADALPGWLTYESATSFKDAASFYETELPKSGWVEQEDSNVSEDGASLHFIKADQDITVIMATEGSTTSITIILDRVPK